jgi:hypothetical protein
MVSLGKPSTAVNQIKNLQNHTAQNLKGRTHAPICVLSHNLARHLEMPLTWIYSNIPLQEQSFWECSTDLNCWLGAGKLLLQSVRTSCASHKQSDNQDDGITSWRSS